MKMRAWRTVDAEMLLSRLEAWFPLMCTKIGIPSILNCCVHPDIANDAAGLSVNCRHKGGKADMD